MKRLISTWEDKGMEGIGIDPEDAIQVLSMPDEWIFHLFGATWRITRKWKQGQIRLCSIVNAKSGLCTEDCSFCSQSRRSKAEIDVYPMLEPDEIYRRALKAKGAGAKEFSVVTSGKGLKGKNEFNKVKKAVEMIKETGLQSCVSIGIVDYESLSILKSAGLGKFHHNLETSRSYFPNVCTTHDYDEDIRVVKDAKRAGLSVCCGGIFGIGESPEHRVELAFELKGLDVDSIPINFLNPIKGTPLEEKNHLTPIECLKIIAMMRLTNPTKDIIICGGREVNLRDMQSLIFPAGANGLMLGNYLTTKGRPPEEDIKMINDLSLRWN